MLGEEKQKSTIKNLIMPSDRCLSFIKMLENVFVNFMSNYNLWRRKQNLLYSALSFLCCVISVWNKNF